MLNIHWVKNRGETSRKYLNFIHFIHILARSLSLSAPLRCLNTDLINGAAEGKLSDSCFTDGNEAMLNVQQQLLEKERV